ncbi:23S rRNA (adenine(2030)-N(6))-methyltransferase RlmJ [Oleispirillum naphthae]|uniref:23S rRNA (adenine(2030)-N(6))-methyltransferase RlmJ n=1 Tax=Oleispirillum naphthae TaxID=2838853 RepID=UPI0030824E67
MLSYLHRYHAGNFADVHKHLLLTRVLLALGRKASPYCVIDTHAGEGIYDLASAESLAAGEAAEGVARFRALPGAPDAAAAYAALAADAAAYPGSPEIARRLMRQNDRLLAVELHPQAFAALKRAMRGDARVHLHRRDALEALVALVPPPEKRGVVVIDPAYEVKDEYRSVPAAVAKAFARWRAGVFLVWYPLLPEGRHEALVAALAGAGFPELLISEWHRRAPEGGRGLYGSGVAVVNPPWKLKEEAEEIGAWLETAGFGGRPELRFFSSAEVKPRSWE